MNRGNRRVVEGSCSTRDQRGHVGGIRFVWACLVSLQAALHFALSVLIVRREV